MVPVLATAPWGSVSSISYMCSQSSGGSLVPPTPAPKRGVGGYGMSLGNAVPISIPVTHLPSPGMCRTWRLAPAPRRAPPPGTWPLAPALAPGPPPCPQAPAAPPRPPPALPGAGSGSPRSLHGPAAHPGPPEPRQQPPASTGAWGGGPGGGAGDATGSGCGAEGKRGWHGPPLALFGCRGGGSS